MNAKVWARIKALKPAVTMFWFTPEQGQYKQPDNNRRLKRLAIRDHGFRQFKRKGVLRQYNLAQKGASHA